jgi:uncharacterized protein
MKIILDTNVYFSAFGFNGQMLQMLRECFERNSIIIYHSPEILAEIEAKIFSDRFRLLTKNKFSSDYILDLFQAMKTNSQNVNPSININICRDPKDNMFLSLAQEIAADYIVSGDRDLLVLNPFQKTQILTPADFRKILNPLT